MKNGFSLVELSIVLVILGLLTGGILAGQSLIHAAEIRSLTTESQKVSTATMAFRDRYFGLPGDIGNATSFWAKDNTNCPGNSGTTGSPGACNGNANGVVENTTGSGSSPSELFQFWRQLALAGLVEGSYSGLSGASYPECIPGTNCPRAKYPNATMILLDFNWVGTSNNGWWNPSTAGSGNWLVVGAQIGSGSYPFSAIITAQDAWNIDTKMDDGKPARGSVMAMGCTAYHGGCMVDGSNAAPTSDCATFASTAQYKLDLTGNTCTLMFRMPN